MNSRDTLDKGMIHGPRGKERNGIEFYDSENEITDVEQKLER